MNAGADGSRIDALTCNAASKTVRRCFQKTQNGIFSLPEYYFDKVSITNRLIVQFIAKQHNVYGHYEIKLN